VELVSPSSGCSECLGYGKKMDKTIKDLMDEIRNIKTEAASLASKVEVSVRRVTENLNFLKDNHGKITKEDFKRIWEETKIQTIECERYREEWMKLQLRLYVSEKELGVMEATRKGYPFLH